VEVGPRQTGSTSTMDGNLNVQADGLRHVGDEIRQALVEPLAQLSQLVPKHLQSPVALRRVVLRWTQVVERLREHRVVEPLATEVRLLNDRGTGSGRVLLRLAPLPGQLACPAVERHDIPGTDRPARSGEQAQQGRASGGVGEHLQGADDVPY